MAFMLYSDRFKKMSGVCHPVTQRLFLRMRTMEVCPSSVFLKGNGRTGTLHNNTSSGNEQRLYPQPFNVPVDGVSKYGFKGFPVFAIHGQMITQYDIMSMFFYRAE
jgi:hypothetical protein